MKKGPLETLLLSGLGIASITQEKMQKFVDDMVKQGEMSEKEGSAMVKKMMDGMEKNRREMEARMNKTFKEMFEKTKVPTRREVQALEKKIDDLNRRLEAANKKAQGGKPKAAAKPQAKSQPKAAE
jgi:polyhydroxyalkanoate synthesis regulator phasin